MKLINSKRKSIGFFYWSSEPVFVGNITIKTENNVIGMLESFEIASTEFFKCYQISTVASANYVKGKK